jgi:hypothetical protein
MKNNDQATQSKGSRSFTQEMQQAFVDWVKKLPFIKRDIVNEPGRKDLERNPLIRHLLPTRPTTRWLDSYWTMREDPDECPETTFVL